MQNAACTVNIENITIPAKEGSSQLVPTAQVTCTLSVDTPNTDYKRRRFNLGNALNGLTEVHHSHRKDDKITVTLSPNANAGQATMRIKQVIKQHGFYVEPQVPADA